MTANQRTYALLGALVVFAIVTIGGLVVTKAAVDDTSGIVTTLQYNATRGDCIRDITASAEQQFRKDIADLIAAGDDMSKLVPLVARMQRDAKTNYADTVQAECPPAIKESP